MRDNFIWSRVEKAENSLVEKNEFLVNRDKLDKNLSMLEDTLSTEQQKLLENVLDCKNAQCEITCEVCYCKGFSDCVKVIAGAKLD